MLTLLFAAALQLGGSVLQVVEQSDFSNTNDCRKEEYRNVMKQHDLLGGCDWGKEGEEKCGVDKPLV